MDDVRFVQSTPELLSISASGLELKTSIPAELEAFVVV